MKPILLFLGFCAAVCIGTSDRDREEQKDANPLAYGTLGYGIELILTKFEVITSKLQSMEGKLQRTENKLQKIENQINEQRSTHEQSISTLQTEMATALQKLETLVASQQVFSSCQDVKSNVSGIYLIGLNYVGVSVPFRVYCEQKAFGGGWIVIQHRFDGSLDFYRGWNEFRDGFGSLEKEFWLGLEKVHQITNGCKHELIVELKDFSGSYAYARYDAFEIGSESEDYVLKDLGTYSGTAGESMSYNKDEKFSTKDRDNDQSSYGHCAEEREGAWWHLECTYVNLNGRYMDAVDHKSMYWDDFKERQGLSYSRMMIREVK